MQKKKKALLKVNKVNKKSIALATHVFDQVAFDVYFNHLYCMRNWSQKYDIVLIGMKGLQAAAARESMVQRAFEQNCSHIFFLDGDHLIPEDTLDILWESNNAAMVSGLVCKKGENFQQVGWATNDEGGYIPLDLPLTGLTYEVGVCAFGCTLINLAKLKRLTTPYFRDTCGISPNGDLTNIRSDVNLCNMFRDNGEKILIDTRILVGHHGVHVPVYPQSAKSFKRMLEVHNECSKIKKDQTGVYYE